MELYIVIEKHIDDGTRGETGIELSGKGILGIDYSLRLWMSRQLESSKRCLYPRNGVGLNGVGELTRHIGDDTIALTGGQILCI
jgi:hypothetical protein